MSSRKSKYFHKKEKSATEPATLSYLNKKRQNPTDMHPIQSPAVDPFSQDDVDQDVDQAEVLNRREETVPVSGRNFHDMAGKLCRTTSPFRTLQPPIWKRSSHVVARCSLRVHPSAGNVKSGRPGSCTMQRLSPAYTATAVSSRVSVVAARETP
jgi:hypothetical protein